MLQILNFGAAIPTCPFTYKEIEFLYREFYFEHPVINIMLLPDVLILQQTAMPKTVDTFPI